MAARRRSKRKRNAALYSSKSQNWATPEPVGKRIVRLFRSIALDPCAAPHSTIQARARYFKRGLEREWPSTGLVYVNPPYGLEIVLWIIACVKHAARGGEVLMLLPARVDTGWWEKLTRPAGAHVALVRGRLPFELPGRRRKRKRVPAPFPSAFVYFGPRVTTFRAFARASRAVLWTRHREAAPARMAA